MWHFQETSGRKQEQRMSKETNLRALKRNSTSSAVPLILDGLKEIVVKP